MIQLNAPLVDNTYQTKQGNYMQFKDEIKNLELLMDLIKGVYLKRTKFDSKDLEEILSHDLCMGAQECLDYGLVDIIL